MKKVLAVLLSLLMLCPAGNAWAEDWFLPEQADVVLPSALRLIEASAFSGIKAKSVYIRDGVMGIGSGAFSGCKDLTRVRIPSSVQVISDNAFDGCSSDLRIYGIKESAAHRFSDRHSIPFIDETTGEIVDNNTLPAIPFF